MSTQIFNAYRFSGFTESGYAGAIELLQKMRREYIPYLAEHMFDTEGYTELDDVPEVARFSTLCKRMEADMASQRRGAILSAELDASIVVHDCSIVLVFFPQFRTSRMFVAEYAKDLQDWSYNNQVDDDFDRYERLGIDDFWDSFLNGQADTRWRAMTPGYSIFDRDDVFDAAEEILDRRYGKDAN